MILQYLPIQHPSSNPQTWQTGHSPTMGPTYNGSETQNNRQERECQQDRRDSMAKKCIHSHQVTTVRREMSHRGEQEEGEPARGTAGPTSPAGWSLSGRCRGELVCRSETHGHDGRAGEPGAIKRSHNLINHLGRFLHVPIIWLPWRHCSRLGEVSSPFESDMAPFD